jgi:hypothetical protein
MAGQFYARNKTATTSYAQAEQEQGFLVAYLSCCWLADGDTSLALQSSGLSYSSIGQEIQRPTDSRSGGKRAGYHQT